MENIQLMKRGKLTVVNNIVTISLQYFSGEITLNRSRFDNFSKRYTYNCELGIK